MLRRYAFRLPRHPASVGLARHRVRDHLAAWGHGPDTPAVGDALLLVSELATNVVRHGPLQEREFEVAVTALAVPEPGISGELTMGTPVALTGLIARPWENDFN
ncbi:ATP-binding protein, partial [Streptomyces sp. NPDC002172]